MNKTKVIKILMCIFFAIIIIFLVATIRKMIIIKDLSQKIEKYINSDNYYEKITNNSGTTTEFFRKRDNSVLFMSTTTDTGEIRKLTSYYTGEKRNSYIESGTEKVALLNNESVLGEVRIIGLDYRDNLWQLFQYATFSSIKSGEYNGKECYIISLGKSNETYIEKETGLRLKARDGTITDEKGNTIADIVEYYYEFGNVSDEIFAEPDISQYKIQGNN